jgi:hypothetical protein
VNGPAATKSTLMLAALAFASCVPAAVSNVDPGFVVWETNDPDRTRDADEESSFADTLVVSPANDPARSPSVAAPALTTPSA